MPASTFGWISAKGWISPSGGFQNPLVNHLALWVLWMTMEDTTTDNRSPGSTLAHRDIFPSVVLEKPRNFDRQSSNQWNQFGSNQEGLCIEFNWGALHSRSQWNKTDSEFVSSAVTTLHSLFWGIWWSRTARPLQAGSCTYWGLKGFSCHPVCISEVPPVVVCSLTEQPYVLGPHSRKYCYLWQLLNMCSSSIDNIGSQACA